MYLNPKMQACAPATTLLLLRHWLCVLMLPAMLSNAIAQKWQNPRWLSNTAVPEYILNAVVPPVIDTLPFTAPVVDSGTWSSAHYPFDVRHYTAANGSFDNCGNLRFYVAGDWIFDRTGLPATYLQYKDLWIKWGSGVNANDNPYFWPEGTENTEAPVCPVPGKSGRYFCFYSNCKTDEETELWVTVYDVNLEYAVIERKMIWNEFKGKQMRFALSQPVASGLAQGARYLYINDGWRLYTVLMPADGTTPDSTTMWQNEYLPDAPHNLGPEMELSPDGRYLVWAGHHELEPHFEWQGRFYFYDIQTAQYSEWTPQNNGELLFITGLEYLPYRSYRDSTRYLLTASILWRPDYTPSLDTLNGIWLFDYIPDSTGNGSGAYLWESEPHAFGTIELGYWNSTDTSANMFVSGIDSLLALKMNAQYAFLQEDRVAHTAASLVMAHSDPPQLLVQGLLPDQIDGETYNSSYSCQGGDPQDYTAPWRKARTLRLGFSPKGALSPEMPLAPISSPQSSKP